ncbi:hypothetical protein FRC03_000664 [Tulasnella sp. 419]|nr:hypothetical protein FRC03_000664 [Tulasnella sp. 419]
MTSSNQAIGTNALRELDKLAPRDQASQEPEVRRFFDMVPTDNEEFDRHSIQHQTMLLIVGLLHKVPNLVRAALLPNEGMPPTAAEFGIRTGCWAVDLSNQFPHVKVVGIDSVPSWPRSEQVPENCSFEVHDINLPLTKYHQSFNVCHVNHVGKGIRDHEDFLYRIPEVLRTSGILLMTTGYSMLYKEDKTHPTDISEGEPGWCAAQALFSEFVKSATKASKIPEGQDNWQELLHVNPYLTSVGVEEAYIPVGPWPSDLDETSAEIARLAQINVLQFLKTMGDILLSNGFDEVTLNRWTTMAREEVTTMKPRLFSRFKFAWGVRNSVEWVPKADAVAVTMH